MAHMLGHCTLRMNIGHCALCCSLLNLVLVLNKTIADCESISPIINTTNRWFVAVVSPQDTTAEMAEHSKDLDTLKSLSKELCPINPEASKAQIQGKLDSLTNDYSSLKDIVKEK